MGKGENISTTLRDKIVVFVTLLVSRSRGGGGGLAQAPMKSGVMFLILNLMSRFETLEYSPYLHL
jgi:hypothetical protein